MYQIKILVLSIYIYLSIWGAGICYSQQNNNSSGNKISISSSSQCIGCDISQQCNFYINDGFPLEEVKKLEFPLKNTIIVLKSASNFDAETQAKVNLYYSFLNSPHKFDWNKLLEILNFVQRITKVQSDSLSNLSLTLKSISCSNTGLVNYDSTEYLIKPIGDTSAINNYHIFTFLDGYAVIKIGNKYGFIDRDMKIIIPPYYISIWRFSQYNAVGKIHDVDRINCYILNLKTHSSARVKYDEVYPMYNNWARVKYKDGYTFIDKDLKPRMEYDSKLIPLFNESEKYFNYATNFSQGFAAIQDYQNKWHYINAAGSIVSAEYLYATCFNNQGHAIVSTDEYFTGQISYFFIDTSFKRLSPLYYNEPIDLGNDVFAICEREKLGLSLGTGFQFLDCRYDSISYHPNGYAIVGIDTLPPLKPEQILVGDFIWKHSIIYKRKKQRLLSEYYTAKVGQLTRVKYNLTNKYGAELFLNFHDKIEFLAENIVLVTDGSKSSKWKLNTLGTATLIKQ